MTAELFSLKEFNFFHLEIQEFIHLVRICLDKYSSIFNGKFLRITYDLAMEIF